MRLFIPLPEGLIGQCTSNFLFRSPDNATLYLGTARHCVNDSGVGAPVEIGGATSPGVVAYIDQGSHDFALIAINESDRARVHPAVLYWGGPTGLMDSRDLDYGDEVWWYGNSSQRGDLEIKAHRGYVTTRHVDDDPPWGGTWIWTTHFDFNGAPAYWGDSGSPVLSSDGRGVGVLTTLHKSNGAYGLHQQFEAPRPLAFELVTWPLLNP